MSRARLIATTLTAISLATVSLVADAADVSINGGWSSEYIFRGVPQSDSSAFAGLDIEHSGFYFGAWAADVGESGEGLEVDLYGGYSGEWRQFSYAVGVTSYLYTDDFDDRYFEINLNGDYSYFTLDIAIGEYDNFSGPTLDYQYYTLAAEYNDFYASISSWGNDYEGEAFEFGYENTLRVGETDLVDYRLAVIHSGDIEVLGSQLVDDDTSLVLSVSKTFDLKYKHEKSRSG